MFVGFSCGFKELEQEEGTWTRRMNLKNKTVAVCAWIEQEDSMRNWRREWNLKKTMELDEEHSNSRGVLGEYNSRFLWNGTLKRGF